MALEALALSQQGIHRFGCGAMTGGAWNGLFGGVESVDEGTTDLGAGAGSRDAAAWSSSMLLRGFQFQDLDSIPAAAAPPVATAGSAAGVGQEAQLPAAEAALPSGRKKRRRTRAVKNKEEAETQRMTHIAVERNRRKQMNEYLAALRSLMPSSYAQRGDQASIVGGAINFVKELEQLLQSLQARKQSCQRPADGDNGDTAAFAGFFTFPQYSMSAAVAPAATHNDASTSHDGIAAEPGEPGSKPSAVAEVEATMVESHANLRVLSRRRPRQLLRLVMGLQGRRLTVLHLNMTSSSHMVLYSFSLKVEDDCQLTCVDDIATAAHQILEKIEEEQGCSLG